MCAQHTYQLSIGWLIEAREKERESRYKVYRQGRVPNNDKQQQQSTQQKKDLFFILPHHDIVEILNYH